MNGEDSAVSALSNTAVGIRQGSDSNDTSLVCAPPAAKRQRTQDVPADSDRFKGVVPQQNGYWGAQIYANHRRVWLGTFKSEELAAIAYDRAASKLRNHDSPRNFPGHSAYEPMFQHKHDADVVLKMIRDGSYDAKFAEYMHATTGRSVEDRADDGGAGTVVIQDLFQKELTPSDVGKLNRLVIPKKHAVTYFPPIQVSNKDEGSGGVSGEGQDGDGDGTEGMMLEFRDRQGRRWEFRYSYWRSSQSYVFTKGWNKFVKSNELCAKDTVVFYRCEGRGGAGRAFCMIDVVLTSRDGDDGLARGFGPGLRLGLGSEEVVVVEERGKVEVEKEEVLVKPAVVEEQEPRKGFKLFGVYITC